MSGQAARRASAETNQRGHKPISLEAVDFYRVRCDAGTSLGTRVNGLPDVILFAASFQKSRCFSHPSTVLTTQHQHLLLLHSTVGCC